MVQPLNPNSKQLFIEAGIELAKELQCHGKITGEPPFAKTKSHLGLDQILWIQVMMRDLEGMKLTLELGADANYRHRGIHILELALAFGDKGIVHLLESYSSKLSKKVRHKKSSN